MEVSEALNLVNGISYKPGWTFAAAAHPRFDESIDLRIRYVVQNSDVRYAPDYTETMFPPATMDFFLSVHSCHSENDLYQMVFECLAQIERHEMREFFAVDGKKYRKPFHPHTVEGMSNWANQRPVVEHEDYTLGLIALS